jgi:hypothetical protein
MLASVLLGLVLVLGAIGSLALAESNDNPATSIQSTTSPQATPTPVPLYARVIVTDTLVYTQPAPLEAGLTPVRSLGAGYLWVTITDTHPITVADRAWYQINPDEYVPGEHLALYSPSTFHGITITTPPTQPFGWLVYYVQPVIAPGAVTTTSVWLPRYNLVTISATTQITEGHWYEVGPEQWVYQTNLAVVQPIPRPSGVGPAEKWIDINLFEQTVVAYEGDRMAYATLMSAGLPRWPTEKGLTRLRAKIQSGKMAGGEPGDDYYFLEDVPWIMYFRDTYALHGAYWHDKFGFPHSHGCVNLSLPDARWFFEWVTPATSPHNWTVPTEQDPGTWVWVHGREVAPEAQQTAGLRRGR